MANLTRKTLTAAFFSVAWEIFLKTAFFLTDANFRKQIIHAQFSIVQPLMQNVENVFIATVIYFGGIVVPLFDIHEFDLASNCAEILNTIVIRKKSKSFNQMLDYLRFRRKNNNVLLWL